MHFKTMFFATLFLSPRLLVSPASISTMAWCHENDYFACCSLIWLCTQVLTCCKRNLWVQGFILATSWLILGLLLDGCFILCHMWCLLCDILYLFSNMRISSNTFHYWLFSNALVSQVLVCWTASRCFLAFYFCDKLEVIIKMHLYNTC